MSIIKLDVRSSTIFTSDDVDVDELDELMALSPREAKIKYLV